MIALAARWLQQAKAHEAAANTDVGAALRERHLAMAGTLRQCAEELIPPDRMHGNSAKEHAEN